MTERAEGAAEDFWIESADEVALRRYRTLVNAVEDGIYQLDADGRFVAVNDVIVEITGYDREELLGEHVSTVLETEDVERIEREISRRLATDEPGASTIEFAARTADGGTVPCELQLNLLVDGGTFRGTVGIVRDVSHRKRTERQLRQRERQLQRERDLTDRLLETSPVGIMVLDGDGEIVRLNERGRELLDVDDVDDYSPGQTPTYDDDGRRIAVDEHPFARALETGEPVYDRVLRIERPDGGHRWLSVNATPVLADDGSVDRVITTGQDVTDLKERERSLERRTDELATELDEIYGRITDGFTALNGDWEFTHVNERAEEILGVEESGLLGRNIWEVFPDLVGTPFEERYREAMANQESVSFEQYHPPDDAWYEEHVYPSETGLSIYFRDVTERERLRSEIETTFSRITDAFYALDTNWEFTYVNDRAEELIDFAGEGLVGKNVWEEFEWAADSKFREEYERAMETQEATSFEIYYPKPLESWYEINAYPSKTGLSVYFRDISDRKERERRLEESERRYRTLAEYFPNGIVTLFDHELVYTLAAGQGFGEIPVDPSDLEEESFRDVWDDETADALEPIFHAALAGEERSVELAYEGREWVVHAVPITDDRGEVFAGMTMAQDITDRIARERQLEELVEKLEESNDRLERFAYAASHDLQEPLRMVSSYLQLLERRYADELDDDAEEFIEFAVDGADRMREMIDGLLAYSRVETQGDPFEPVDLNAVLDEVVADLRVQIEEADAVIDAESLPRVEGDAGQLRQLFQNLLDNAITYSTDAAPRVRVAAERREAPRRPNETDAAAIADDRWEIAVSDEGIGIDPDKTEAIFEVFQRLHARDEHPGTGIGLALCQRIVERHGGEIRVDSEPGEGSTFSFTLPATDEPVDGAENEEK